MNVVGKVGSLLSQGVYSVATPFHPFGGAVDIIVVQQQNGSFRSTPWYVRFGMFQGVLKGSEEIVQVSVNGIEANFRMYLDHSGEAYFVREIDSSEENQSDGFEADSGSLQMTESFYSYEDRTEGVAEISGLEHSDSDSGAIEVRDPFDSSTAHRIDQSESDDNRKFYDFHDENCSQDDSLEICEYGSNHCGSFGGDNLTDSLGLNAEVVLVSVDGHMLTAPILASEKNGDNLLPKTHQFHLGLGESADFCKGNEDMDLIADPWGSHHVDDVRNRTLNNSDNNRDMVNQRYSDRGSIVEVVQVNDDHSCQSEEPHINHSECEVDAQKDLEDGFRRISREDVFKSCLEMHELVNQNDSFTLDIMSSQSGASNLPEMSLPAFSDTDYDQRIDAHSKHEVSPSYPTDEEKGASCSVDAAWQINEVVGNTRSDRLQDRSFSLQEIEDELVRTTVVDEAAESIPQIRQHGENCNLHEMGQPENIKSNEKPQTLMTGCFEISLCRSELKAGMGLAAAAETFRKHQISADEFLNSSMSVVQNENLVVRYQKFYLTWEKAVPIVLGAATFGLDMPVEQKDAIPVEIEETSKPDDDDSVLTSTSSGRRWSLWPIHFRRVKTLQHETSNFSSGEVVVDTEPSSQNVVTSSFDQDSESPQKQLVRTNVPTRDQIASLNLKEGQNVVTFSFSTILGKQQVDAHIYLWMWDVKIVISDVDGTITKSDVLGQFMPLVGRDWTQSGVARLFSAIEENGYQLLFLSARAIVQAYLTRSFLLNLKQDGKNLPNGPVVISPDGLFPSLYREVIRRAPHEFKIACLEDIKSLFPADHNPFYAGFGNRDTDELSYRKIGIPKGKIFIINPKGEVASSHRNNVKTYTSLHTLVNDMFPPTSMVEQEDYNSWNYWKVPIPDIDC